MKKSVAVTLASVLVVFTLSLAYASSYGYEKFRLTQNDSEERIYAECTCIGSLSGQDSYPPEYKCEGINYCRSVNYTRSTAYN